MTACDKKPARHDGVDYTIKFQFLFQTTYSTYRKYRYQKSLSPMVLPWYSHGMPIVLPVHIVLTSQHAEDFEDTSMGVWGWPGGWGGGAGVQVLHSQLAPRVSCGSGYRYQQSV